MIGAVRFAVQLLRLGGTAHGRAWLRGALSVCHASPELSTEKLELYVRGALPLDFVNQELQALVAAVGISALLSVIAICLVTILLSRHLGRALQRLR